MDDASLKTYVTCEGKTYYVSTNSRQTSAAAAPDIWYWETHVWECDKFMRLGKFLEVEGTGGMYEQHKKCIERCLAGDYLPDPQFSKPVEVLS